MLRLLQEIAIVGFALLAGTTTSWAQSPELEAARDNAARDPKSVEAQLELATVSLKFAKPTDALRAASAAATLAPNDPRGRAMAVKAQIYSGLYDDALKAFDTLPEGAKNLYGLAGDAQAAKNLSIAEKLIQAAEPTSDVEGFRNAARLLEEAARSAPELPEPIKQLGWLRLEKLHEPHLALPYLEKAYAHSPNDLDGIKLLAQASLEFGKFAQARQLYERVIANEPKNNVARVGLGRTLIGLGERVTGLRLIQEVLDEEPTNVAALLALAEAEKASSGIGPVTDLQTAEAKKLAEDAETAIRAGEYRTATELLNRIARLEPQSYYAPKTLGYLYLEKFHRPETARRYLAQALRLKPSELDVLKLLGVATFQSGDHCRAIGLLSAALNRDPSDHFIRATLGRAYARAKRYGDALSQFDHVLARDPNDSTARLGTAEVIAWRGRTDQPMQIAQSLVAENPSDAEARILLGDLYRWDWNFAAAEFQYDYALRYDPRNSAARTGLYEIDKSLSYVASSDGYRFLDNRGFDRRYTGGALRIPFTDKAYISPRYVDWNFAQGPIALSRREAIVDVEYHFSRQLSATTRWLNYDYTGRNWQSAVSVTTKYQPLTAVKFYASGSANEPAFLTDIGIPLNNIRMNNYGLGYDIDITQRISTQGAFSYSDYSDSNERRFGSVQGSYRIFPCRDWFFRLLYEDLAFADQTITYFSPSSFDVLRIGLELTQPVYRKIDFVGKFEALDVINQGWGYAVKFGPSAKIRDRIEVRASYFNLLVPGGAPYSGEGFDFFASLRF